jgi:hypothetical protein
MAFTNTKIVEIRSINKAMIRIQPDPDLGPQTGPWITDSTDFFAFFFICRYLNPFKKLYYLTGTYCTVLHNAFLGMVSRKERTWMDRYSLLKIILKS